MTSSVAILKSGISSYAGISLDSFDHQRQPKRSFFARTSEDQNIKLERCEFGGVIVIGSIGEQNGLDVHIVEGLNVITVLNVIES